MFIALICVQNSGIKYSEEALKVLISPTRELMDRFDEIFPGIDPLNIIESWNESLLIMGTIASNRDECQWFAPLYPSDKAFTKNPFDVLDTISKNVKTAIKKIN